MLQSGPESGLEENNMTRPHFKNSQLVEYTIAFSHAQRPDSEWALLLRRSHNTSIKGIVQ